MRGPKFQAMVLARDRMAMVKLPDLSAAQQAAVDPAFNRRCIVCLGESPTPEPCGCACNGRYVHAGCQASLAARSLRSARDAAFDVLSKTSCPVCNHMLLPGLILRAERVPQALLPVPGSAELQRIIDAEVRAAAELALGRPRSAIRTATTGLKLAMDLVHVDHPSSHIEKGIGYAAMIRMTEHAALANAAAGKYDRAEPLIAAVINKRQELRGRDDAANFSAIVAWSNKYAIDAQMDVPAMVLPRLLDLFADLGTSPWATEMYSARRAGDEPRRLSLPHAAHEPRGHRACRAFVHFRAWRYDGCVRTTASTHAASCQERRRRAARARPTWREERWEQAQHMHPEGGPAGLLAGLDEAGHYPGRWHGSHTTTRSHGVLM